MSNLFSSGGAGNVGFSGEVQQSLKFNDDESQYLSWTPAAAGNRKTWTWSGWVKRGNLTDGFLFAATTEAGSGNSNSDIRFYNDSIYINDYLYGIGSTWLLQTTQVFRDLSAWYHIILAVDTTQATASDRIKLYVNGVQVTSFSTANYPALNSDGLINSTSYKHKIGNAFVAASSYGFDGYLSDVYFIDGQALDPTSFGQFTNGYWEKIDYAGSYGTNGFHLTFEDDVVSEGFNAVTYTGTGATQQSISGLGFSPDLVWLKSRNAVRSHGLFDSVRGRAKGFAVESTNSEYSSAAGRDLVSFDGDGFTVGNPENFGSTNASGDDIVGWAWDAGSGSPVSNTDGTITSTVKANPSYGFSITSYTGTGVDGDTVGHGLSSAPELAIIKGRTGVGYPWAIYGYPTNPAFPADGSVLYFDDTAMTESTGSELSLGASTISFVDSGANINGSGQDYICYAFHSVAGYSKISSYSGTGAAGNAVTGLGFKPAFLMIKRAVGGASNWRIYDNTRDTTNPRNILLFPDDSGVEATSSTYDIDFDADGFTLNGTNAASNASGNTYIYMAFADTREAAFWKDVSGQGNHWTPNNLDYRDSLVDSPANNFATLNPLDTSSINGTLSEGNLKYTGSSSNARASYSTFFVSTGKYYYEGYVNNTFTGANRIGFAEHSGGGVLQSLGYRADGQKIVDGSITAYGAAYTDGDVIGCAVDADNNTVEFFKNGVSQGQLSYTKSYDYITAQIADGSGSLSFVATVNFGQDSTFAGATTAGGNTDENGIGNFQYAPPAGYLALCTANLPEPTIIDGSEYFNTVLYTGNGTTNNITGVGFQPDFVWAKGRNAVRDHILLDVTRGTTKMLSSNLPAAAVTGTDFASFDADGFTLNAVDTTGGLNASGGTFAAWNWKAGTSFSNTAGTNDATIDSSGSANSDFGFSIVSWTGNATSGAKIFHGLSQAPEMILVKNRIDATNWGAGHKDIGWTKYLTFSTTSGEGTSSLAWDNTAPTSSVITLGNGNSFNGDTDAMIAYCFHSSDLIKVGSYTGNNNVDGPFCFTGFRPAWIMIKKSTAGTTGSWLVYDSVRSTYNPSDIFFYANEADAEYSGTRDIDFLSNGFKIRDTSVNLNNTNDFVFLAFAETPFKFSTAR